MSLTGRLSAAWAAFRAGPGAEDAPPASGIRPMATAVALTTECRRPDGGNVAVLNALLSELPRAELATVAAGAAVIAAAFGEEWSSHDATGPDELLSQIGLAVSKREAS